jgi:hypothetical protein
MCLARSETPMSGFRARSRPLRRRSRPGMTVWGAPNIFSYILLTPSPSGLYSLRPAPPRGAIAIVTFAGQDAVDAGDAASRGLGVTSVFGQDGSAPALPLARRRPTFGWKDALDSVTDDQVKTCPAQSLEAPFPSPWDFNSRSERSSRQSASNRKNTAGGTLGNRSCFRKS